MYEWLRKIMLQCWIEFSICWNMILLHHYAEKGKIKIQLIWSFKKRLHTRSIFTLSRISMPVLWFWQTMHTWISSNFRLYNLAIKTNILSQQEKKFIYCIIKKTIYFYNACYKLWYTLYMLMLYIHFYSSVSFSRIWCFSFPCYHDG